MRGLDTELDEPSPRATTIDHEPGRFRFSIWRNVTITIWTDQATRDAAERVVRVSRRLVKEHPRGRTTITFICPGAPAPSAEANELFGELYKPNSGIACMGIVLEGSGFWASRMRSMVTGLRIAAGNSMVVRIQDSIEELVEWLPAEHSTRTGHAITRAELEQVLRAVRAEGT